MLLMPMQVKAACSPYLGLATLNEFFKDRTNQRNDPDDFLEVKMLDSSIPFSIYSQWTVQSCEDNDPGNSNDADGCSSVISLGDFTDTAVPWLVLKDGTIGRYYNFKTGFDSILLDDNGDVIDYVSVDDYSSLEDGTCTGTSLPYDYQFGSPGASDKFIFRTPDGTGDWDSAESASQEPTEDTTNDGEDVPVLSFSNVSIEQGTTSATITLNLEVTSADDIIIDFSTIDGDLTTPEDYTEVITTNTISAGATSISFTVPVSATSDLGDFYFFININSVSPGLASISNHVGNVTVTAPSTPAIDHYAISHGGIGVTCEAEAIVITPHDASDLAVAASSSTTITLTTSIPNDGWALRAGNGTFTSPNQYTFDGTETAVEFWLTKTSATSTPHMDIDVTDGTVTDLDGNATEDPNLEFRDTAFRFYADGIHNDIGSQIAGKGSEVAPGDQVLALRAVQTNTDTGACEARISGTQAVEMAFECDNPTTCKTNNGVTIIDSVIGGAGDAVNDNPAGGPLVYSNVDLTFDASGIATWSMNYLDAGQITLHALLNIPASGNDPADSLAGSSNSFPSIPAGLCVSSPDVDADCGSGNASCSAFKRAGETFNLSVKAVGWQSSGESNTDFCTGNTTTPNFQLAGITLNQTLVAPVGVAGNLGIGSMDIAAADDGDATINNQSLSEVGVFTLTATAPSYFGETIAASTSANIGRFYPDHFVLSDMQLINRSDLGCASAFTYMDENFQVSFDLEAQNTANTVTQNYSGAFAKLDSAAELNYGAVDLSLPTDLSTRLNVGAPTITFTAGRADDLTDTLFLSRLVGGPDGPFSLSVGIAPVDDDGVSLDSYNLDVVTGGGDDHGLIQSTLINYGRLTVGNAHGSELLPLTIPLKAQFYDGLTGSFIGAAIDNCTLYDAPLDINLASAAYTGPLTAGDLGLTGAGNLVAGLASFSVHDDISNTVGPGVTGDVTFVKVVPAYLQYDWDGDNSFNDDPWARATFGIFGGNSKQIYYRQLYR